ncbi:hypothetical protein [Halobaculum halobium]|nr:hypothetical protein [Halobaculum sp. SYNS20]
MSAAYPRSDICRGCGKRRNVREISPGVFTCSNCDDLLGGDEA